MNKSADEMRELALSRAEELGAEWGRDKAGWYCSATWDTAKCVLTLMGIDLRVPEVLEEFPEWDHSNSEHGMYELARVLDSEGFEVGFDMGYVRETGDTTPMYESFFMESAASYCGSGFKDAFEEAVKRHCEVTIKEGSG